MVMTEKQEIELKTKIVTELKRYVDSSGDIKHWKISNIADGLVKNINYDALLATGRKCIHAVCSKEDCPFVMNDEIECPLH